MRPRTRAQAPGHPQDRRPRRVYGGLGACGDPARHHHHWQTIHECDDRLERGASDATTIAARKVVTGTGRLRSASPSRAGWGGPTDPANRLQARRGDGCGCRRARPARAVVSAAFRSCSSKSALPSLVKVIHDIGSLEHTRDGPTISRIRSLPRHAAIIGPLSPRDGYDVSPGAQRVTAGRSWAPKTTTRSSASPIGRAK